MVAVDFWKLSLKTQWDVDNDDSYAGGPWTITIAAYSDTYEILNILSNGALLLADPNKTLPTSNVINVTYILKNDDSVVVHSGNTGKLAVTRRGRVDVGSTMNVRGSTVTLTDVRELIDSYHGHGQNRRDTACFRLHPGTNFP